jgi:hypothetical protein
VYGKEKYFGLGRLKHPKQDKYLLYRHRKPIKPTQEGPLTYVLLESPFASVSTVSRGHLSLVSHLLDGLWEAEEVRVEDQQEEKKNTVKKNYFVLNRLKQPWQAKNLLYRHDEPNNPTKEGLLSYVLLKSPLPQFQQ